MKNTFSFYWQVSGPNNCVYIASLNGLTEINQTTGKTRKLMSAGIKIDPKTVEEI